VEKPALMPDERTDVIREKPVEPDVLKAQVFVTLPELGLPVGPKRQRGVTAANRVLPAMRERGPSLG
jgi:hypothetical protein